MSENFEQLVGEGSTSSSRVQSEHIKSMEESNVEFNLKLDKFEFYLMHLKQGGGESKFLMIIP